MNLPSPTEPARRWPDIALTLRRGWQRHCPRCGEGELFRGLVLRDRCPVCNLLYLRNHGDLWLYMIITDRIPLLFAIAAVFFGFRSENWITAGIFLGITVLPVIATARRRQGFALAVEYLFRVRFPDPTDEIHRGR